MSANRLQVVDELLRELWENFDDTVFEEYLGAYRSSTDSRERLMLTIVWEKRFIDMYPKKDTKWGLLLLHFSHLPYLIESHERLLELREERVQIESEFNKLVANSHVEFGMLTSKYGAETEGELAGPRGTLDLLHIMLHFLEDMAQPLHQYKEQTYRLKQRYESIDAEIDRHTKKFHSMVEETREQFRRSFSNE